MNYAQSKQKKFLEILKKTYGNETFQLKSATDIYLKYIDQNTSRDSAMAQVLNMMRRGRVSHTGVRGWYYIKPEAVTSHVAAKSTEPTKPPVQSPLSSAGLTPGEALLLIGLVKKLFTTV